jgi:tetratricopeptide (TPR) repeat protein
VDPIIRICKLGAAIALLIGSYAAQAARDKPSALGSYVQARLADASGAEGKAVAAYRDALTADPDALPIALRAYRQAVESGDKALALRSARLLEAKNALPVDGDLLLLGEAFAAADWKSAERRIVRIEEGGTFGFLAPVLRGWLVVGTGRGDPLGAMSVKSAELGARPYVAEHSGLIMLAMKHDDISYLDAGILKYGTLADEPRNLQLRLSLAQRLIEVDKLKDAVDLLSGDDRIMILARDTIAKGRPIGKSVTRPSTGLSMLLARLSNELSRDNASGVSVTLGRLAVMADPDFTPANLVLARSLGAAGKYDAALDLLNRPSKSPVSTSLANGLRLDILLTAERYDDALAMVKGRAESPTAQGTDIAQLAEVLARMGKPAESAEVYAKAIERWGDVVPWNLWLLKGREYDLAGNWAKAKPALQQAVTLAPNEPSALNHLGYSMIINGERADVALPLLEKASRLRPNDAAIADSLGYALLKSGEVDRAVEILEAAARAEPTIAEISQHLGDAYWTAGRRVEARYAWAAALEQADDKERPALLKRIDLGLDRAIQ